MNTKITTLRLPKELADELDAVARADRLPVSELVRAALYRFIAERRTEPDFKERLTEVLEEDRKTLERLAAWGDLFASWGRRRTAPSPRPQLHETQDPD